MKKIKNIYIILLTIIGLALFGITKYRSNSQKNTLSINGQEKTLSIYTNLAKDNKNFKIFNNLESAENNIRTNKKWVLYVGSNICGDCNALVKNVMPDVLKQNPEFDVMYLDYQSFGNQKRQWNKIIGQKNEDENKLKEGMIKGFNFMYTPTLVFIENGKAKFVFDDFGGGDKYKTRYFRWVEGKEKIGYQNAINDINQIYKKF